MIHVNIRLQFLKNILVLYFYYIHKSLMGHRIYEESTTSKVLKDNGRTKEDYEMFRKFWPKFIAKRLTKVYQKSEKSNKD